MQHYSHKKYLVQVVEEKDDVVLLQDYEGSVFPVTEQRFKDYYIGVDLATGKDTTVTKQLSPFELEYAKQLVEFGGLNSQLESNEYIKGTADLSKNKAF